MTASKNLVINGSDITLLETLQSDRTAELTALHASSGLDVYQLTPQWSILTK